MQPKKGVARRRNHCRQTRETLYRRHHALLDAPTPDVLHAVHHQAVATHAQAREREGRTREVAAQSLACRRDLSSMSLTALTTADVFYAHIDRARSFFARHVRFESRREAPGRYAVDLHYREGLPRSRASCLVGKGVLHAVPLLFDLPPAVVTEHACRLDGADHCSYSVEYRHEPPLAIYGAGLGTLIAALGALLLPSTTWLLVPLGGWLFGREIQHARTRAFMARVTEEQRRVIAENEADFQRRFDEMKSLYDALERRPRQRNAQSPTNTS